MGDQTANMNINNAIIGLNAASKEISSGIKIIKAHDLVVFLTSNFNNLSNEQKSTICDLLKPIILDAQEHLSHIQANFVSESLQLFNRFVNMYEH